MGAVLPAEAGPPSCAVTLVTDVDAAEWDAYVRRHPRGTVDHLWAWRRIIGVALGHEPFYLAARRAGVIAGVLPLVLVRSLIFGRSLISLPFLNYGGVLADEPGAVAALLAAARDVGRQEGASHVELRHQSRELPALPCRQHKLAMKLALPETPDLLWHSLDRKVRNQVRKGQKSGLVVERGGAELLGDFYRVFARNMRDLGTPVYPECLFSETLAAFPESSRVFVVRASGAAAAAGIVLGLDRTVINPWASSLREYRHLSVNMLLYWAMLQDAVEGGAAIFDFGRSSPDGGTYQFKMQWGATASPMTWEYALLSGPLPPEAGPTSARFRRAVQVWQRLPLAIANAVGPRLARHLP